MSEIDRYQYHNNRDLDDGILMKDVLYFFRSVAFWVGCLFWTAGCNGPDGAHVPPTKPGVLPVEHYLCDGLAVTLESDGSSSISFRNGTTRALVTEQEATLWFKTAAKQQDGVNNGQSVMAAMAMNRIFFAMSKITGAISTQIVFERQHGGDEASDVANKWIKTKTISFMLGTSGSLVIATKSLSSQEVDELLTTLNGRN